MKKLLVLLSSITLIGTGTLGTIEANSSVINKELLTNNLISQQERNIDLIIKENRSALEKIDHELVLQSLIQVENKVIIDYQLYLDQNLTSEMIELIKEFSLTDITVEEVAQFFFAKQEQNTTYVIYSSRDWQIEFQKPNKWYEWVSGKWILELNHHLVKDMITGGEILREAIEIIGYYISSSDSFPRQITVILKTISEFLSFAIEQLGGADQGNGVFIKFYGWIIPVEVNSSSRIW